MNDYSNNSLLLLLLFAVPAYLVILVYYGNSRAETTYPLVLYLVAVSLLLMHGLTTPYLNGRDVHYEYYAFTKTAENLQWSIQSGYGKFFLTLSTSLLPTIYFSLTGISPLYIYKLLFQLVFAATPVVCYFIAVKYLDKKLAFLSALFFIVQFPFIYTLQSNIRSEFGILFFALVIWSYLQRTIPLLQRSVLFLIFSASVVISHYAAGYLLILMFALLGAYKILRNPQVLKRATLVAAAPLIIAVVYLYSQINIISINYIISHFYLFGRRDETLLRLFGIGLDSWADVIVVLALDLTFFLIVVGVIVLAFQRKAWDIPSDLFHMMIFFTVASIIMLILPFASIAYGGLRLYMQALVLLAPAFIIGTHKLVSIINKQWVIHALLLILVIQFANATLLTYQLFGIPYSQDLNRIGPQNQDLTTHPEEIQAASWLVDHNLDDLPVYTDYFGRFRVLTAYRHPLKVSHDYFKTNQTVEHGFIYLRTGNIQQGLIYNTYNHNDQQNIRDLNEYHTLLQEHDRIYTVGKSHIYSATSRKSPD